MTYRIEPLPTGGRLIQQQALTRQILLEMTGTDRVEHTPDGRPYLPQRPDLHISISHCRNAVAVAISDKGAVGIDIECRRRVSTELMQRVCTPDEIDAIRRSDDPTLAFLQCWTRKEAVLKCRGTGIRGFTSMVEATLSPDCTLIDLHSPVADTVATLACAN